MLKEAINKALAYEVFEKDALVVFTEEKTGANLARLEERKEATKYAWDYVFSLLRE